MNVLLASSIDPDAIAHLRTQHDVVCAFNAPEDQLCHCIADREILIFRSGVNITANVMACAPNLRLLIRAGSGIDNIDLDYVKTCGIDLVRIPEPGARAVAELTFAHMLTLARQILVADRLLRHGRWAKHTLTGHTLKGKVLGIVGTGTIGTCVAELGVAWGMQVIGCVGHPSDAVKNRLGKKHIGLVDFSKVLTTADFVSVHVPLKKNTRHLIDARALRLMKPSAFLINTSRGGVVDERALYRALQSGNIAGAALDVHAREGNGNVSPVAGLPNVVLTPHIGSTTAEAQREIGCRIIGIVNACASKQEGTQLAVDD